MLGNRILPPPEVIWAIFLEDSPCCGVPAPAMSVAVYTSVFWL